MKLSRGKLSIILFLLGFLFIVLDVNIDTGIAYPNNYNNSDNVIGEFQYLFRVHKHWKQLHRNLPIWQD